MSENMSNNPHNPFDDHRPHQGYAPSPMEQRKSNVWLWVLGAIGVLTILVALICCGGGYFAYQASTGFMAELFKDQLVGNPVIEEHIGTIDSMSMNLGKTSEYAQGSPGTIAFDISGPKGSGVILIRQESGIGGEPGIGSAELIMADGSRHPVTMEDGNQIDDDFQIDLGQPADAESAENLEPIRKGL